jgi:hypothetical protein
VIGKIADEKGLTKGDCLEYLIDKYESILLDGKVKPDEYIPPNIKDTLIDVDCSYIEFISEDDTFYCLEKYHKTKKKDVLGIDPEIVRRLCLACKQGKADLIEKKLADERRKESFKKIEDFLKGFITITTKGFIQQTYLCKFDAIDGAFYISRDGKTLTCPLNEMDIVTIKDQCMCALNPKTAKPPCQYLITLEHLVQITKEDIKEMDLELPSITYEEPEPKTSLTKKISKEHREKIEADYKVLDEEDQLEIEKEDDKNE